jgi:hypothetical protein
VKAREEPFNPFTVFHMDSVDTYTQRFGFKPASPAQIQALQKFKLPGEQLRGLSKRQAAKLLGNCIVRSKRGLASYGQLRKLQEYGVTKVNISKARASSALDYISSSGWKPDPERMHEIIHSRRRAGE